MSSMSYLSDTLSEVEYLAQKSLRSKDTAGSINSSLTNAKLFTKDAWGKDFYIVMADLKREAAKTGSIQTTLVFLQKFVTWATAEHPELTMEANQHGNTRPFTPKSVGAIRGYVGHLRQYLKRVGGIPVTAEDVGDYIVYQNEEEKEEAEALTHDELRTIIDNQKSFRRKMLYKITKDTCSRIRAMCMLRRENVNLDVRPIEITFPKHIMKGKKRTVIKYVSDENEKDFIRFLKGYTNPRDLLFGTHEDGKMAAATEQKVWNRFVKKLGFTAVYRHSGRLKKNIHSIKSFTETAAEDAVDAFYANAYGDHTAKNYLSQYIRWSYTKKIEKFRKLEDKMNLYTITKMIPNKQLAKENLHLSKKIDTQGEIIQNLAEQIKSKTSQMPKEDIRKMILQVLEDVS